MRAFPREIPASSAHFTRFSPHRLVFRDRTPRNAHFTHFSPRSAPQRSAQEQDAGTHPSIRPAAFGGIRRSCRTALRKEQTTCKAARNTIVTIGLPHKCTANERRPDQSGVQVMEPSKRRGPSPSAARQAATRASSSNCSKASNRASSLTCSRTASQATRQAAAKSRQFASQTAAPAKPRQANS